MLTFRNLHDNFEDFAGAHQGINSFSTGDLKNLDREKFQEYPIMHLTYTGATYEVGVKTYNCEIYFLDVPRETALDIEGVQIVSNMERIVEDLLSDIQRGHAVFRRAVGDMRGWHVSSADTEAMFDTMSNTMSGVRLNIGVVVSSPYDACFSPLA